MYFQSMYNYFGRQLSYSECAGASSTPKPKSTPSSKKALTLATKPDDDEDDLWSAFEDDSNKGGKTPKTG
jgi:hypothetical protein